VIDPSAAVPAVKGLHKFLGELKGPIRLCDPYFDAVTVEHLDACAAGTEIKILTKHVKDDGTVRRPIAAAKQKLNLEIRKATTADLHDRYIVAQDEMLILGTSLNGFGKRQSFVIKAGQGLKDAMTIDFDGRWATGTDWP
jgi:hypothetical protein